MNKGWVETTLGDIGNVAMCKRIFKEETTATGDVPFYKIGTFGRKADAYITSHTYSEYRVKYPFPKRGDVLISASGTIGRRVRYDGEPAYFQDSNIVWIDNDEKKVLNDYLYHFYGVCEWNSTKGATISRLYNEDLRRIVIAFPESHQEQRRIVGILDEAFDALATATANAEQNLRNARALFESHLQSVFAQQGKGWVEKRLEDVCVIGDGNHSSNYPKKEELVAEGVPFIRATNLVAGEISDDDMRFLSPEKHAQLKKGHLKTGDILFTNRGEIGKTAIVDAGHDGSNLNSQIAWLRCRETLNNRFLFHVLNSGAIKSHLELSKNGAALQQFTIRQIKELKIPIPPKDEQKALVVSLDGLSEETQRLKSIYQQKLAALDELKKSLLHQAFTGEL